MSEALLIIGLATALAYGQIFLTKPVSMVRTLTKTLPLTAFALAALSGGGPVLLVAGFALSAVGDACLSREGEKWFIAGLGSFLVAHLAYVALFLGVRGALNLPVLALTAAMMAVLAALILIRIWPALGPMRVPVLAYMAVISGMALAASQLGPEHGLAMAGALMFVISDAVLALELFAIPGRKWTLPVVWASYVAAQLLIGAAFLL